jgi:hypothetical protein
VPQLELAASRRDTVVCVTAAIVCCRASFAAVVEDLVVVKDCVDDEDLFPIE